MQATTYFTCRWPEVSLFKKQDTPHPPQLLQKKKKEGKKREKKNENKENTLGWMHSRAPAAPVLSADLYNFVNLDLFRSQIMQD